MTPWAGYLSRAALAFAFAFTGTLKFIPRGGDSATAHLLPYGWAIVVGGIELVIGMGLTTRHWRHAAAGVVVFSVTAAAILFAFADRETARGGGCGCFGPVEVDSASHGMLLGALLLLSLGALTTKQGRRQPRASNREHRR